MRGVAECGAEVGEECGVLWIQEYDKIANSMSGKEMLLKAVLDLLKGLRSKTCPILSFIFGGHQAFSASCAHGVTWISSTHSRDLGVTEAVQLVLPWSVLGRDWHS